MIGLTIAAFIWWRGALPPAPKTPVQQTAKPAVKTTKPAAKATPSKPIEVDGSGFDFYDMLPNYEVVVPDEELEKRVSSTQPLQAGAYLLQAGSFASAADAERMKALLAFQGMQASVVPAQVKDRTVHRVRIGPLEKIDTLNSYRSKLREAGIDYLVIRVDQ